LTIIDVGATLGATALDPATGATSMTESYTVVWNGTQDTQQQKARQKPAPTVSERERSRPVFPAGFGHTKESDEVIDLRDRWTKKRQQT
jgi:hypothetical protein